MITINLVCVGNLKEKFSKDEQNEYLKRLGSFAKVNVVEVKEQNHLENIDLILAKEGEEIKKNLKGIVVLCEINSKECSSVEFANLLKDISMKSSIVTFVVGGSYGVCEEVKKLVDMKISFSKMTFPHNLFRIMLLEQIYRAFTILSGKAYHK